MLNLEIACDGKEYGCNNLANWISRSLAFTGVFEGGAAGQLFCEKHKLMYIEKLKEWYGPLTASKVAFDPINQER